MGITGLLPLMKAASSDVKLEKLSGTVAAIDTNGWIHRACYSCGDKVYLNEETDMYINYCVNLCGVLQKHNITPILVFDGQSLPAKAETKAKRQKRKEEVRKKIDEMLRTGDNRGARWLMRQCVDVNFEMVHRVIQRCRNEKIDHIVAPFEADAQIAYLVNHGIADYAITEDSDLLVFGCKKTLYKLDRENEKGSMLTLDRLDKCFKNFCERKFQYMCILSGCDYLANIPNVGLGRARKFFESLNSPMSLDSIQEHLTALPAAINMEGKVKVTNEYIKGFVRAVQTFDHQLVFSPFTGKMTHLKNLKGGLMEHNQLKLGEFAGDFFDDKADDDFITHYVAGNIHTKTLEKMDTEFTPFAVEGTQSGKFFWFAEELCKRVNSKKTMNSMVSSLFVPESPVKPKTNESADSRESKRKVSSPLKSETPSELPTKRIKSVSKKKNDKDKQSAREVITESVVVKQKRKSLCREEEDELVVATESIEIVTERKVEVNSSGSRQSRSSTRNVFRRSETELKKVVSGRSSSYFQKSDEQGTSPAIESEAVKQQSVRSSRTSLNKKPTTVISDDSDFDECTMKSPQKKKKANLDVSVSSIEDEDKVILSSLNSTQSSGYASQQTAASSPQSPLSSASQSPPPASVFTQLKSPSSGANTRKLVTRTSKRISSSQDIRSFFGRRN